MIKKNEKSYSFLNKKVTYDKHIDCWCLNLKVGDLDIELYAPTRNSTWAAILSSDIFIFQATAKTPEAALKKLEPRVRRYYKPVLDLLKNK